MRKKLFLIRNISAIKKNVRRDEDLYLRTESLQCIPDQPYSKPNTCARLLKPPVCPEDTSELIKGNLTLTEDYI